MSKLILVDGSSYLHRAFHALPPLTNKSNEPTGALYGCINMLRKILREESYDYFAVIIDHPGKNFRHQLFPQYKANRLSPPADLIFQMKIFPDLVKALGIPVISLPGVEADDVIATLTKRATLLNWEVLISTGDKDLAQLVNAQVTLYNTMQNQRLDPQGVYNKFGVYPSQIVDYLSLIGDDSDNIPGVAKVGPKTASKWLANYHSLENLLLHQEEIKGKVGLALKEEQHNLPLVKQLITLKDNLTIQEQLTDLTIQRPTPKLKEWYGRLGFKLWLTELDEKISCLPILKETNNNTLSEDYHLLNQTSTLAFYWINSTEVALATDKEAFITEDLDFVRTLLQKTDTVKITFDIKRALTYLGGELPPKIFDLMLANYLLDTNQGNLSLDELSQRHLSFTPQPFQTAWVIYQLYCQITSESFNRKLLEEIDQPLSLILWNMEQTGILINLPWYQHLNLLFSEKIKDKITKIFSLVPHFNLNSPNQLQQILYQNLGLPIFQKTPKGKPSTSEETLTDLRNLHPVIPLILEYRELAKLKSTYLDPLPAQLDKNNRIHTTFHQTITVTGRLSSSNPNLQNIPIRTENGRTFRKLFIAPPYKALLAADYSQIELRILAHLAEDPLMINGFRQNLDLHALVAQEIFNDFSPEIGRQKAKTINFGLIYGMSSYGLSKRLGLTLNEAKNYIEFYFQRFPKIKEYIERTINKAKIDGFVTSLLNRRFYLPNLSSRNFQRKTSAERLAVNATVQGSAAEIVKLAMLKLNNRLSSYSEVKLLLQIHDELVWEIPINLATKLQETIKETMENIYPLKVPLKVNLAIGNSWEEAH